MRGIGDLLSAPLAVPELPAVLVNPGVPVPTKDVFGKLGLAPDERRGDASEIDPGFLQERSTLISYLKSQPNDLEVPAISIQPVIADVIAAIERQSSCLLARMSGSGATCFGLFATEAAAASAAKDLSSSQPAWWVAPTVFSASGRS
jgi:4-diphosphocytidyl-2-C-methyl-D-erythritol kinase